MTTTMAPVAPGLGPLVALDGLEHMNRELRHELREAHAQNLALRALLAEHGIDAPAPPGVVTLKRLRALENVLDLVQHHLRNPTPGSEAELRAAAVAAGRQP